MTRVLQLRRGTSAQNNDFTGMPGEITFDMDAKTVRVHDGETLGGFALQRADGAANGTGTFDITTVSDDFWARVVAHHAPAPFSVLESAQIPMNCKTAYVNYTVGDILEPIMVRVALLCLNDQAGYSTGDQIWGFGIGEYAMPCVNCFINDDGLNVRLMVGAQKYWTPHRDTGIKTELSDENWNILFYVYY